MKTWCVVALALVAGQARPEELRRAQQDLEKTPDDPAAHLVMGKHELLLGRWDTALRHLSQGSDKGLKEAALKDLGEPTLGIDMARLGDEWAKLVKGLPAYRSSLLDRATYWHGKAWLLAEAPEKEKLRLRLRQAFLNPAPAPARKGLPAGWFQDGEAASVLDGAVSRSGRYSVRIQAPPKGAYAAIKNGLFPAVEGTCEVSAWVLTDGTEGAKDQIHVRLFNASGQFITFVGPFIPTDRPLWTRIDGQFKVNADVARMEVAVVRYSQAGTLWVDDLSLKLDGKELLENRSFEK